MAKIINDDTYEETPYKKKKGKKKVKKSSHKHNYVEFLGLEKTITFNKETEHIMLMEECSICKKTRIKKYFLTKHVPGTHFSQMINNKKDAMELYPELELKEIEGEVL